ncbi:MAG: hypothetical protein KJ052_04770 [Candidatus Hydrogenedentes bacterium]|nr:hypothetical protein [Candidatus Hydrogenedentota bacterium]
MADKIIAVIHDDWELRGNGLGNVAHLQYLPAVFLMNLAKSFDFRLTFTVEVLQQLTFLKYADGDSNLRLQAELWESTVALMLENGFDVQLHVHPHWHHSEFRDGFFYLDRNWNLAAYPAEERRLILKTAHDYLAALLKKYNSQTPLCAFKAGSYGIQPSAGILEDLSTLGIKVLLGVQKGLLINTPTFSADFRELEEHTLPYYPDPSDINKVADTKTSIVSVPIAHYVSGFGDKYRHFKRHITDKLRANQSGLMYYNNVPSEIQTYNPLKNSRGHRIKEQFLTSPYRHIDLGSLQTFAEWRCALDQIIRRLRVHPSPVVPFILESHTKNFFGRWEDVKRFFDYFLTQYGSFVEFDTLAGLAKRLSKGEIEIAIK